MNSPAYLAGKMLYRANQGLAKILKEAGLRK